MPEDVPKVSIPAGCHANRYKFTRSDCVKGFWAMVESVASRYPDAVDASGRHMVCNALPVLIARKGMRR